MHPTGWTFRVKQHVWLLTARASNKNPVGDEGTQNRSVIALDYDEIANPFVATFSTFGLRIRATLCRTSFSISLGTKTMWLM